MPNVDENAVRRHGKPISYHFGYHISYLNFMAYNRFCWNVLLIVDMYISMVNVVFYLQRSLQRTSTSAARCVSMINQTTRTCASFTAVCFTGKDSLTTTFLIGTF